MVRSAEIKPHVPAICHREHSLLRVVCLSLHTIEPDFHPNWAAGRSSLWFESELSRSSCSTQNPPPSSTQPPKPLVRPTTLSKRESIYRVKIQRTAGVDHNKLQPPIAWITQNNATIQSDRNHLHSYQLSHLRFKQNTPLALCPNHVLTCTHTAAHPARTK